MTHKITYNSSLFSVSSTVHNFDKKWLVSCAYAFLQTHFDVDTLHAMNSIILKFAGILTICTFENISDKNLFVSCSENLLIFHGSKFHFFCSNISNCFASWAPNSPVHRIFCFVCCGKHFIYRNHLCGNTGQRCNRALSNRHWHLNYCCIFISTILFCNNNI